MGNEREFVNDRTFNRTSRIEMVNLIRHDVIRAGLLIVPVGIEIDKFACFYFFARPFNRTSSNWNILAYKLRFLFWTFNRTSRNWNYFNITNKTRHEILLIVPVGIEILLSIYVTPDALFLLIVPVGIEMGRGKIKWLVGIQTFNRTSRNWNNNAITHCVTNHLPF